MINSNRLHEPLVPQLRGLLRTRIGSELTNNPFSEQSTLPRACCSSVDGVRFFEGHVLWRVQSREGGGDPGRVARRLSSAAQVETALRSVISRRIYRYIYTEEADITAENVESVLVLSDKYLLNGLFAASIEWIKRNVTASNALRLLPLTELYSDLAERYVSASVAVKPFMRNCFARKNIGKTSAFSCWQAVFDHGEEVLNSSEFLSIPKNLLAQMLSSDELIAAEKTVYTRVLNWAKCQLEQ